MNQMDGDLCLKEQISSNFESVNFFLWADK